MSTDNQNIVEPQETDLDAFSEEFFGQNTSEPGPTNSEANEEENNEESDAPNEQDSDTDEPEGDKPDDDSEAEDEDTDDDAGEEEDETPAPQPKKKNRFQERIDELNGRYREEQRQREALEARLAALEGTPKQDTNRAPAQTVINEDTAPKADDKNEDGTEKYPLGEFDPGFIKDLTKHTLAVEKAAMDAQAEQERQQAQANEVQQELDTQWQEKLVDARERYPDFNEKGQSLVDSFGGLDEAYGEYLTTTIMSMDHGTDVLYHLANNPDEAKAIVALGARKATLALGALETKFADVEAQKQLARPKVSNAPAPPPRAKGSAPAKVRVEPDTDDLDAFEREFFNKRKKG